MRISPIGGCRCRHGTRPRDEEHEQGQCETLVTVRLIRKALVRARSSPRRRANRPDERREPEQHECEVKAFHPLPRHTVQARRLLHGVARRVLARVRLVVRERVLDVGVPNLAFDEELLECDLKDLGRALAQPVGRR